jgi:hypothetical protein
MNYNRSVRRLLAITLLILFGLPLITQLFAFTGSGESALPLCCRKNGAHHCMMRIPAPSNGGASIGNQQHCPAYPAAVAPTRQNELSLTTTFVPRAEHRVHSTETMGSLARAHFLFDRSQQQRGPPSFLA